MLRTRIKICGVRSVETALLAAEAGADAVGLVFVPASPRCVTAAEARAIVRALPAFVEPVGLFVDQPVHQVQRVAAAAGLRTVQLHGQESPEDVAALAPLRVIKGLAFDHRDVSARLVPWRCVAGELAAILWDAPPKPAEAARQMTGGAGVCLDWDALAAIQAGGLLAGLPPMILAGGLTPENVGDAIARLAPYAVDVSSGVERSRGIKDHARILAFCQTVRAADATRKH